MRERVTKSLVHRIVPWSFPILIILVWQLLGQTGRIAGDILPTPIEVIQAGIRLARSGQLETNVLISTQRAFIGFVIGGSIGFVLGLINGVSRLFENMFDTSIQMIRTIPHLALIPLVILWFGIDEEAKIFLVSLGVAFPIYLNTFNGIKNIDAKLIEMGRAYGLKRYSLFFTIIFPGALPSILVGVRYSLGIMWTSLIVAETIGADSGIGFMATSAREFMQMDVIVLTIVLYALLGKLSDFLASLLEKRFLQWHPSFQNQKL